MLLKIKGGDEDEIRKYYIDRFEKNGVSSDRIEIIGWVSKSEHLEIYGRVDIALDTYPYHGTTTTCEALWMGVPVVSLIGEHHVSRVGLSLLNRVNLRYLAANNAQEYIASVVRLAGDIDSLSKLRSTMRARVAMSGLCWGKNFAREFEAAYRMMWHRWCSSQNCESETNTLSQDNHLAETIQGGC